MSERERISREEYEELLKPLGKELSAMARWVSGDQAADDCSVRGP